LQKDLEGDLHRVEEIKNRAEMHLGQAEAQLQTIDATSSRAELNSITDFAMQRLSSTADQPPLALQAAKLEEAARQQVQAIMRDAEEADRSH
jgi:exonuclease VII small subunit